MNGVIKVKKIHPCYYALFSTIIPIVKYYVQVQVQELLLQLQVQLVPLLVLVTLTVWVLVCVMESLSLLVLVAVLVWVWVCVMVGELVLVVSTLTLVLGDPMLEMLTEEEGIRGIRNLPEISLLSIPLKPEKIMNLLFILIHIGLSEIWVTFSNS